MANDLKFHNKIQTSILRNLFIALIYFFTAKYGLALAAFVHKSATLIWPPSGISLAAVLIWGTGVWPGIALGAFAVNLLLNMSNPASHLITSIVSTLGITAGNTGEALLGFYLLNRFSGLRKIVSLPGDYMKFVFIGVFLCPMVSATLGVFSLAVFRLAVWKLYGPIWLSWWLGDAVSILIFTPFLLLWYLFFKDRTSLMKVPGNVYEGVVLAILLCFLPLLIFGPGPLQRLPGYPLAFTIVPVLIWAALRFGRLGSSSAILITSIITGIFGMQEHPGVPQDLFIMHIFLDQLRMATAAVMINLLAIIDVERKRSLEESLKAELLKNHAEELEQKVSERTSDLERVNQELSRSNSDLEQFAYVASHDLQEPLRMVASYVQLVEGRLKEKLDSETREFFGYVVDGTSRMKNLIHDLLEFSRSGRSGDGAEPLDLNEIMKDVLNNIQVSMENTGASVSSGPLPKLTFERTQFVQLFQNLISNAIKFHGTLPPEIRVEAGERENDWLFSVKDNGIGIDPQHKDRIFGIFQRLHPKDKYPGTGVGLAICKKIVERNNGHIWVESEPGKGSVFYFTVPKAAGINKIAVNGAGASGSPNPVKKEADRFRDG